METSDIRNLETADEVSQSMDRTKYEGINRLLDDCEEHNYLCDLQTQRKKLHYPLAMTRTS